MQIYYVYFKFYKNTSEDIKNLIVHNLFKMLT